MRLKKQVALVTGGSRGIGKAIVQSLAKEGAQVIINYAQNEKAAKETLASLPKGKHIIVQANVGREQDVKLLIDESISHFGRIDILVNNAGIHQHHPIDKVSFGQWTNQWKKTLAVNLIGPSNLMFYTAQHMIKNGGGRVINISSRGAFRGEPDQPAYGSSKAGLNALSQSLAQKLAPYNIYVTAVAPCFTETDMVADLLDSPAGDAIKNQSPLGRVATPEDVANAVLFLACPGSEYMTGAILDVNGASYLR